MAKKAPQAVPDPEESERIIETVEATRVGNYSLSTIDESALTITRPPDVVLREAAAAAAALADVLKKKPNKVMMGDKQYLEHEDWQTVGRFYGIAPQIEWTKFVEFGEVRGWESRAAAIHVPTGRIVATGEAMCLNDEEKWKARAKYVYAYVCKSGGISVEDPGKDELIWEKDEKTGKSRPKKQRVRGEDEAVPMFQLRSMAQTRASAKALRNALAWVVVLAGYGATPAEELPDAREEEQQWHDDEPTKATKPTPKAKEEATQKADPSETAATPGQRKTIQLLFKTKAGLEITGDTNRLLVSQKMAQIIRGILGREPHPKAPMTEAEAQAVIDNLGARLNWSPEPEPAQSPESVPCPFCGTMHDPQETDCDNEARKAQAERKAPKANGAAKSPPEDSSQLVREIMEGAARHGVLTDNGTKVQLSGKMAKSAGMDEGEYLIANLMRSALNGLWRAVQKEVA